MVARDTDKKKRVKSKHGGGDRHDTDDSSIDSKGNIRDLIDYDYDDDDDSTYGESTDIEMSSIESYHRKPRKAAIKAGKKIKSVLNCTTNKKVNKAVKGSNKMETDSELESDDDMDDDFKQFRLNGSNDNYDDSDNDGDDDTEPTFISTDTDEDDDIEDDEDEEEGDDDEGEEDEGEEEHTSRNKKNNGFGGILLTLGGANDTMVPKRHNLKKEPENVKKFVKLITAPVEDNSIDNQIDQFKVLTEEKQAELITALERRPTITDRGVNLMLRILTMKLPQEIQTMILAKYNSLQSLDNSSSEYFKLRNWLDKVVSIPFGIYKDIPVRLEDGTESCAKFMETAKKCLDGAAYGQDESKLQIMQFISTKIANPSGAGLSLLLVGPPGIGKTTIIKNGIAKALNWPFQFISLGGDSDASTYTGHQLVYESSHCGKIVNSLIASKSMSTVLMFDEIDKISQTPKGEEIQNLLIHLTDPVQNSEFEDKYLAGVPIDLSKVMFVFSANDINKIDKVLLDRMMVIDLKGYDTKQKVNIAENYLLPAIMKEVNLLEKVAISKDIIEHIIETYAKEEKGVRELRRCLEQVVQKINMLRMYNSKDLPFHIKDFSLPFIVKKDHISLFLKKKEDRDLPPLGMYI